MIILWTTDYFLGYSIKTGSVTQIWNFIFIKHVTTSYCCDCSHFCKWLFIHPTINQLRGSDVVLVACWSHHCQTHNTTKSQMSFYKSCPLSLLPRWCPFVPVLHSGGDLETNPDNQWQLLLHLGLYCTCTLSISLNLFFYPVFSLLSVTDSVGCCHTLDMWGPLY